MRWIVLPSPFYGTKALFVLRCTKRLLDRLSAAPALSPAASSTVLGDWYANLIHVGRTQVVLAVSARTLLPVVVPAKEAKTLPIRLAQAIELVLQAVGVSAEDIAAERGAMEAAVISKTADRRVLGSLKELAFMLEVGMQDWPDRTLLDHALWLARTPMKAVDYGSPDSATVAAFAAHLAIGRASGTARNER